MSDDTKEQDDASFNSSSAGIAQTYNALTRRHLCIGWWSILFFLSCGVVLEGLHIFDVEFYRDVGGETTRLMWRLAHVHGALLGLVHIAFGVSVFMATDWFSSSRGIASVCLILASVLLPCGFLFGGLFVSGGDPSLGIALVPVGALLLFAGVLLTARGVSCSPAR